MEMFGLLTTARSQKCQTYLYITGQCQHYGSGNALCYLLFCLLPLFNLQKIEPLQKLVLASCTFCMFAEHRLI